MLYNVVNGGNMLKIMYFSKTFVFMWTHGKKWMLLTFIMQLVLGFLPVCSVWLTTLLVNEVSSYLTGKGDVISSELIMYLVLQLLVILIQASSTNVTNILNTQIEQKVDYILEKEISTKSSTVPILYFENHNFYNHLDRIYQDKANRLISPIKLLFSIMQQLISLVTLLMFLIHIHWVIALLGTLSAIPILIVQMVYGSKHYQLLKYQTPNARKAMYISALLNDKDSGSEIRLFNLKDKLLGMWAELFLKNSKEMLIFSKKKEFAYIGLHASTASLFIVSLFSLTKLLKQGGLNIGSFVSSMQAIQQAQSTINSLSMSLAQLYSQQLFIQDYFEFVEFKDESIVKYIGETKFPDKLP
jgi:ATP-binding cassette, subfamily B, bacterial